MRYPVSFSHLMRSSSSTALQVLGMLHFTETIIFCLLCPTSFISFSSLSQVRLGGMSELPQESLPEHPLIAYSLDSLANPSLADVAASVVSELLQRHAVRHHQIVINLFPELVLAQHGHSCIVTYGSTTCVLPPNIPSPLMWRNAAHLPKDSEVSR